MANMPDDARGPNVFRRYLGVPEADRVPESRRNEIAEAVKVSPDGAEGLVSRSLADVVIETPRLRVLPTHERYASEIFE